MHNLSSHLISLAAVCLYRKTARTCAYILLDVCDSVHHSTACATQGLGSKGNEAIAWSSSSMRHHRCACVRTNKSNVTLHKSPCSPSHKDPEFFRRLTSVTRALTSGSRHPVQAGGLFQPHRATQPWEPEPSVHRRQYRQRGTRPIAMYWHRLKDGVQTPPTHHVADDGNFPTSATLICCVRKRPPNVFTRHISHCKSSQYLTRHAGTLASTRQTRHLIAEVWERVLLLGAWKKAGKTQTEVH